MIDPYADLPVDEGDLEQDAEDLLCSEAQDFTNAAVIVGQLDPLEVIDGQSRWTPEQIALISKANGFLRNWQDQ
jgi:hypothetical protein